MAIYAPMRPGGAGHVKVASLVEANAEGAPAAALTSLAVDGTRYSVAGARPDGAGVPYVLPIPDWGSSVKVTFDRDQASGTLSSAVLPCDCLVVGESASPRPCLYIDGGQPPPLWKTGHAGFPVYARSGAALEASLTSGVDVHIVPLTYANGLPGQALDLRGVPPWELTEAVQSWDFDGPVVPYRWPDGADRSRLGVYGMYASDGADPDGSLAGAWDSEHWHLIDGGLSSSNVQWRALALYCPLAYSVVGGLDSLDTASGAGTASAFSNPKRTALTWGSWGTASDTGVKIVARNYSSQGYGFFLRDYKIGRFRIINFGGVPSGDGGQP